MGGMRKPLQGVWNIVRFNWPFYAIAIVVLLGLVALTNELKGWAELGVFVVFMGVLISVFGSLLASFYVYDLSNLYSLAWMPWFGENGPKTIVNINAGFDETSELFARKYPGAELTVLDFYDPQKHTEVSIKRARKAYPPYPNTREVTTDNLSLEPGSIDVVFAILAAHEIRVEEERIRFFKQLADSLSEGGEIIVTEHLRDLPNFIAYNIGYLHFHDKATWQRTFDAANLVVTEEIKITPFITTFILEKNGTSS
jgi:hypothetical protein